jgi:hypothetical protein
LADVRRIAALFDHATHGGLVIDDLDARDRTADRTQRSALLNGEVASCRIAVCIDAHLRVRTRNDVCKLRRPGDARSRPGGRVADADGHRQDSSSSERQQAPSSPQQDHDAAYPVSWRPFNDD